MAQLKDLIVNSVIRCIGKIYASEFVGKLTGNSDTATKLATARTVQTNLASTSSASFDGSANITPGVTGTLPIANGGTGKTTAKDAANNLINGLSTGTATPQDADYYVSQFVGGGTTATTYHRRPMSALWEYIKSKISSVLGLTSSSYRGNAATATKATQDSAGQQINTTYIKGLSVSGKTVTYTKGDGTTGTITTQDTNTTYSNATTSAAGLMSASDKSKLDGITEGANNYTHPTTAGNKHIPSGGSDGQILGYSASGTAAWTNSVSDLVVSGSLSMGRKADTTIGTNSSTQGTDCEASGNYSYAEGYKTTANNLYGHAEGNNTTANGSSSHAEGAYTATNGSYSHAEGYYTTANACGHAEGYRTTANTYQHAQGHYNDTLKATAGETSGTTGTAFVIGNGTSSSASNAFRVTYAGAVIGKSAYQSTGADFAELREWSDGNPNAEDRRGYFVTMEGMNIKIASPGDYVCGIISANPSVIGNNDEDWMGRYVFDDFGAFVYEDYKETDPETGEVHTYKKYKENPEYDPTREYEFRADRPEWDYVGLCGVIHVRDDGTCQVNGFCKCADGGIATASERGYRVLERVNDHIVKVLFYLTGETF